MPRDVVFRITFDNGHQYKHVHAWVECLPDYDDEGNRQLEFGSTAYASDTQFHKISVTCQADRDHLRDGEVLTYAWRYLWNDEMTLENAESGIKPLRKIGAYMKNAYDLAGEATSFGQYLLRVMKACKVSGAIIKLSDGQYRNVSLDYAARVVDENIQEWRSEVRKSYGMAS